MSYEEADTCFNVGENKTLNFDPRNNPLFCLCFVLFVGKRFVLFVGKGAYCGGYQRHRRTNFALLWEKGAAAAE